jgi:hypothetical protein
MMRVAHAEVRSVMKALGQSEFQVDQPGAVEVVDSTGKIQRRFKIMDALSGVDRFAGQYAESAPQVDPAREIGLIPLHQVQRRLPMDSRHLVRRDIKSLVAGLKRVVNSFGGTPDSHRFTMMKGNFGGMRFRLTAI